MTSGCRETARRVQKKSLPASFPSCLPQKTSWRGRGAGGSLGQSEPLGEQRAPPAPPSGKQQRAALHRAAAHCGEEAVHASGMTTASCSLPGGGLQGGDVTAVQRGVCFPSLAAFHRAACKASRPLSPCCEAVDAQRQSLADEDVLHAAKIRAKCRRVLADSGP
jgi:hypothetical protein